MGSPNQIPEYYPPQVVGSIATPTSQPRSGVRPLSEMHQRYCDILRRVKSARFNAAQRLKRKEAASIEAFAFAGIFGFVLPFFVLIFEKSLPGQSQNVLEFTGFVAGATSLVIGLIEQARDYRTRSAALHQCGLRVNRVLRRLETTRFGDDSELQPLIEEYETALEECGENHAEIDDEIATTRRRLRAEEDPQQRTQLEAALKKLKRREFWNVYWLYLVVWCLPFAVGAFVAMLLPAVS